MRELNEDARIPPLAYALLILLLIIIAAALFPPIKQTIIDIINAARGVSSNP
jgi:hypothetical protein